MDTRTTTSGDEGSARAATRSGPTDRRGMLVTIVLLLLGAALILLASSQDWVSLPDQITGGSGAEVAPAARALGLVGLAGVVAVPASRGAMRRGAGVVLAVAGLSAAVATGVAEPSSTVLEAAPDATVEFGLWWALSLLGGLLLAVAGGLTAGWSGRWPAMGGRYEAPGADRRSDDPWAMLDRGEDPTDQRPERPVHEE